MEIDFCIGTARKMSVDIDVTPDLLLLIHTEVAHPAVLTQ